MNAVFGAGCFWGVEAVFSHVKGVTSAVSGYHGGTARSAKYSLVSSGVTDHAEAAKVTYDPRTVRYDELLTVFFSVIADPTLKNRQDKTYTAKNRSTTDRTLDSNQNEFLPNGTPITLATSPSFNKGGFVNQTQNGNVPNIWMDVQAMNAYFADPANAGRFTPNTAANFTSNFAADYDLEEAILAALPGATVELTDLAGDDDHWAATVTAPQFVGKSRVAQHQMVYAALGARMGGALHALALDTGPKPPP